MMLPAECFVLLAGLTKTNAIHFVINILVESGNWKSVVAFFDIGLATGTASAMPYRPLSCDGGKR